MQTFLPYSDFELIANCLDDKRLNKQILECDTLLDLHTGRKNNSWKNHPAFKMWIGYVNTLKFYRNVMLYEWVSIRGKNSTRQQLNFIHPLVYPNWLYDERVIQSHRTNLLLKFPEHYRQFNWHDYQLKGYFWPCEVKTQQSKKVNKLWTITIKGENE